MTTYLAPYLTQQFFTNNGQPNVGGFLYTYGAGTNTQAATYTDNTGVTPNTNPIVLNSRGECSLWLPANTAYKFVLTDNAGMQIWTRDQVSQPLLLTLYGGVDTGIVNAYVLNFTANFSSYVDGSVVYWIPSNTNTGASTININGLGVINIVAPSGGVLSVGQLVANTPAVILIKGGQAILIQSGTQAFSSSGTFTGTFTGFTAGQTSTIAWTVTAGMAMLTQRFSISGTSNSTAMAMTGLPGNLAPTFPNFALCLITDNGLVTIGQVVISGTTVNFYKDIFGASFTASGIKGVTGFQLMYPL